MIMTVALVELAEERAAWKIALDGARQRAREAEAERDILNEALTTLNSQYDSLNVQSLRLRSALERVPEFIDYGGHRWNSDMECMFCRQHPNDGHAPDCQRQKALK